EAGAADGRVARAVAGGGAQGGVGAPLGVQRGARADGAGGAGVGGAAAGAELHGGAADAQRFPTVPGAGGQSGGMVATVGGDGAGDRPVSCRRPAGPLRAAGGQTAAEELQPAQRAPRESPKAFDCKNLRRMTVPFDFGQTPAGATPDLSSSYSGS